MVDKKEVKKEKKERKALTLHQHYLVDIRRFAKDLGISDSDFGKELGTLIITRKNKKYLALRVV